MNDEILRLTAERDALREALEEVCRCEVCLGKGEAFYECAACMAGEPGRCTCGNSTCANCQGTGRDYHGSEMAKRLLEGGR